MANFFIGLMVAAIGVVFLIFAKKLDDFFSMPTFNIFRSSRQSYQVIGLILIFSSVLFMTGTIDLAGNDVHKQIPENESKPGIYIPPR